MLMKPDIALDLHKRWLAGHPNGERLDLSGADLRVANLANADLRDADLRCSNLRGANLDGATLTAATLGFGKLIVFLSLCLIPWALVGGVLWVVMKIWISFFELLGSAL